MDIESYIISWIGLSLLIGLIAKLKNRSALSWIGLSLLISPLVCIVILIFKSSLDRYEYTGAPSLNNEAYKVYLTKQYQIERVETINKFQCHEKIFEDAHSALRYAQSYDRGMAVDVLEVEDPISNGSIIASVEIISQSETVNHNQLIKNSTNSNNTVIKKQNLPGFLVVIIAIVSLGGIFWHSTQFKFVSEADLKFLENRDDISAFTPDGELAEAFNLNSKYTDVQRENLLKKINGKAVIWVVEVYEVKKENSVLYNIQTSGGLGMNKSNVGTFIELTSRSQHESEFIEALKTGERIRIKGVLNGESILRSLIIKPAILWYPESKHNSVSSESPPDKEIIRKNDINVSKFPRCAGSYEIEKCEAQEEALLNESDEEKIARQKSLEEQRVKNMQAVNESQ